MDAKRLVVDGSWKLFSVPDPTRQQVERFQGMALSQALSSISSARLQSFDGAAEIEISAVAGQPIVVVSDAGLRSTVDSISTELIERAIGAAWPNADIVDSYAISEDDTYTNLREGSLGSGAMRIVLDDARATWIHVDGESGELLSVMDRSRRVYRWLFNGLHSFDFPGFANRRPLWDVTMIALLIAGIAFSLTGVVVGVRRLQLSFVRRSSRRN